MSLTLEEVEHIANLACLELSREEKEHYREQLSAILDYIRKLQEADTSNVIPTAGMLTGESGMRIDIARPGLETEQLLSNAPEKKQNQFKVPPVFGSADGR